MAVKCLLFLLWLWIIKQSPSVRFFKVLYWIAKLFSIWTSSGFIKLDSFLLDWCCCVWLLCVCWVFLLSKMSICFIYLFWKGSLILTRKFTVFETHLGLAYPKFIPSVLVFKSHVVLSSILNLPFFLLACLSNKIFLSNTRKTIFYVVIKETKPI